MTWVGRGGILGATPDVIVVVGGCGIGRGGVVPEALAALTNHDPSCGDPTTVELGGPLADHLLTVAALAAKESHGLFNLIAVQRTFVGVCRSPQSDSPGAFTVAVPGPHAAAIAALDALLPMLGRLLQTRRPKVHDDPGRR